MAATVLVICVCAEATGAPPHALVVLPPGSGETVTLDQYLANQAQPGCGGLGPHECDQRELYSHWGFRHAPLAAKPAEVRGAVSQEQPEAGVTIVRDKAGVPHVFADGPNGATIQRRVAYGIGYAQAEDRLFQMEILRRAAQGRLSDLLGPDYLQMDLITLRDTETAAERAQAIAKLTPASAGGSVPTPTASTRSSPATSRIRASCRPVSGCSRTSRSRPGPTTTRSPC